MTIISEAYPRHPSIEGTKAGTAGRGSRPPASPVDGAAPPAGPPPGWGETAPFASGGLGGALGETSLAPTLVMTAAGHVGGRLDRRAPPRTTPGARSRPPRCRRRAARGAPARGRRRDRAP